MESDKMLDLIEKMYSEMQNGFKSVHTKIDTLESEVKKTNIIIEHEIKPKINALFDGYIQLNEKVDRVEKQVSKQEEFIIRKVK